MNKSFKKTLVLGLFAVNAFALFAQATATQPASGSATAPAQSAASGSLAKSQWLAKVGDSAQNSQVMRETMSQLSPADPTAFVAAVNEAISNMGGANEAKAATFYSANSTAVKSASKGNIAKVLAEIFATVPVEYLPSIAERFATEIFNRSANPDRPFSDAEFIQIAEKTMAVINDRCEKAENSGPREAIAVIMFSQASGGTPANLPETLIATMPDANNREQAKNEWVKSALGQDGQTPSYDSILSSANAGDMPDVEVEAAVATVTSGSDKMVALLGELQAMNGRHEDMGGANRAGGAAVNAQAVGGGADNAAGIGVLRVPTVVFDPTYENYKPNRGGEPGPYPNGEPGAGAN